MNKRLLPLTATIAALTISVATIAPASADSAASTRNTILGIAGLIAGVAIESNVAHKNAQANTISGYLPNGDPVYADGHVAERNGTTFYPGNDNETVACNDGRCTIAENGTADVRGGYDANEYARGGDWSRTNRYSR